MPEKKLDLKDIVKKVKPEKKEKIEEKIMPKREAVEKKLQDMQSLKREHVVAEGETLSHIALKYYGKATPPYYQLIYNVNRSVIGDNINIIVPGQKLIIPELPEDLK